MPIRESSDGGSHPRAMRRLAARAARWRRLALRRRLRAWRCVTLRARTSWPRCCTSASNTAWWMAPSLLSSTRASVMPVVWLPGSIFRASGCRTESSTWRSLSRMTKGATRWTTALPLASSCRARLGVQGISGFFFVSKTKTILVPFFSRFGEDPVRGCLTILGRHSQDAPLANGQRA